MEDIPVKISRTHCENVFFYARSTGTKKASVLQKRSKGIPLSCDGVLTAKLSKVNL